MTRARRLVAAGAGTAIAAAAIVIVAVALSGSGGTSAAAQGAVSVSTAKVQRGDLASMVTLSGVLAYRARADGLPYTVINRAGGIYTMLPGAGDEVGCGDVLYRVDDDPVLLLCGAVPAYRGLRVGDKGRDVRQLNRNLHRRGDVFTAQTKRALERLQHAKGLSATGTLGAGDAVFLPTAVRVAKVTAELGGSARPGAPVLRATSGTLDVRVQLDASQQGAIRRGDRAQITLPGNRSARGTVARIGRVAQTAAKDGAVADATIPAFIGLDAPRAARGLDQAPVQVDVTTKGVRDVLSVPVTALAGKAGGGFAVEVVRAGGRRERVAVGVGLFDTAGGRVQVDGDLRAGDAVVVPSS